MNYQEFKKYSSEVVNSLVIGFAFSNEQFEDTLKEKNWEKENVQFLGGFCPKESCLDNYQKLKDLDIKKDELMKDESFLYEAFVYELQNHEYGYTHDSESTLDALGFKYNEMSDAQKSVLARAKKIVLSYE